MLKLTDEKRFCAAATGDTTTGCKVMLVRLFGSRCRFRMLRFGIFCFGGSRQASRLSLGELDRFPSDRRGVVGAGRPVFLWGGGVVFFLGLQECKRIPPGASRRSSAPSRAVAGSSTPLPLLERVPQRLTRLRVRRLAAARQCRHCGSSGAGLRRTPSDQPRAGRTLRLVAASPRRGGARARPATPCRADFWPAARRNASALPAVRPSSAGCHW